MVEPGQIHLIGAWIALGSGWLNLLLPKGTSAHRSIGYVFVVCMVLTNGSALSLYRLTGHFNMFHVFALVSLAATLAAMLPVWRRRPGWPIRHQRAMQGAYIGLCAAAANEILTRIVQHRIALPPLQFWMLSTAITVLVCLTGALLARRSNQIGRQQVRRPA